MTAAARVLLALLLVLPAGCPGAAAQTPPAAPGYKATDFTLHRPDGTDIAATAYVPEGTGPFPAILMTHGWPGNRHVDYVLKRAQRLASEGYLVVAYDSRGYGDSTGESTLDGPNEVGDARGLIDWIAARPEVQLDGAGDPRLGMIGRSYAGGLAQLTTTQDPRVDVLIPEITWNNLLYALFPNAVLKEVWVSLLFAAGEAETHGVPLGGTNPGDYKPDGTGGASPQLAQWYAEAQATNSAPADIQQEVGGVRSVDAGKIRVPTLFIQGWNDTLFDPSHAAKSFNMLRANGTPTKLVLYSGGHGVSLGWNTTQSKEIERRIDAWFAYYLRHDRAAVWVTDWPVESWEPWNGRFQPELGWPSWRSVYGAYFLAGTQDSAFQGGATLGSAPGTDGTVELLQGPAPSNYVEFPNFQSQAPKDERSSPGTSVMFAAKPFEADTRILGAPVALLKVSQQAPLGEAILMARLVDIAPDGAALTILKQVTPVRVTLPMTPGATVPVTLAMTPVNAVLAKGHALGLGITTSDPAFGASRESNVIGIVTGGAAGSALYVPFLAADRPVDAQPPDLFFEAPDSVPENTSARLKVQAADNVAVENVTLELLRDGTRILGNTSNRPVDGILAFELPTLEPGAYTLHAHATDVSGLTADAEHAITIVRAQVPVPAPASKGGVPGPGVLLLLASVAVVALVRRRAP